MVDCAAFTTPAEELRVGASLIAVWIKCGWWDHNRPHGVVTISSCYKHDPTTTTAITPSWLWPCGLLTNSWWLKRDRGCVGRAGLSKSVERFHWWRRNSSSFLPLLWEGLWWLVRIKVDQTNCNPGSSLLDCTFHGFITSGENWPTFSFHWRTSGESYLETCSHWAILIMSFL